MMRYNRVILYLLLAGAALLVRARTSAGDTDSGVGIGDSKPAA